MRDPEELLDGIARELERRRHRPVAPGSHDREAAVSIILRPGPTGLEFLAIRRARYGGDPWSGHMALPGGGRATTDADLWDTAVRETREEVGLDLAAIGRRLGRLDDVLPSSPLLPAIAISPFVAAVGPDAEPAEGPEVARALWVPARVLLTDDHRGVLRLPEAGGHEFPTLEWSGEVIWGLTFSILGQLAGVLREVG